MSADSQPGDEVSRPEAQVPVDWATLQRPLPPRPEGMGWRDYLIMLLHLGAELEHSLMIQYLYAAYSLNDQAGSPEQRRQVAEWRNRLVTVAKEEMGHLLTVQNLLCLLGGAVCFERSHFPADTDFLPFPFRLVPVSADFLAWCVYAEAPHDWQLLFQNRGRDPNAELRDDIRMVADSVGDTPATGQAHTVGQLYDRIIEVLADPSRIPDSTFRPDTYVYQASWDEWGRGYRPPPARPGETEPPALPNAERSTVIVLRMATRTEAIAALRQIGKQGEAAHLRESKDQEPSHFMRFLGLLDAFRKTAGERDILFRVPINPTTQATPNQPKDRTPIDQQTSRLWATLFNLRYRALLTYLTHGFRLARLVDPGEPNVRGALMHKAFGEMYNLKAVAGILVRRPLCDGIPAAAACAAPPFEMPYSMELPTDEPDCWQQHRDILMSSLAIGDTLLTHDDPLAPARTAGEIAYLKALRQLDQRSVAWIERIRGGLLRHGGHCP